MMQVTTPLSLSSFAARLCRRSSKMWCVQPHSAHPPGDTVPGASSAAHVLQPVRTCARALTPSGAACRWDACSCPTLSTRRCWKMACRCAPPPRR